MPSTITIDPAAVAALAAELVALGREVSEDAARCRSVAAALSAALGGEEGWSAGAAATAWAGLLELLADGCRAVADTLRAAVHAYAELDGALARQLLLPPARVGE